MCFIILPIDAFSNLYLELYKCHRVTLYRVRKNDKNVSFILIVQDLNIPQKIAYNHLNKVGYKEKLNVWVPHE